MLKALPNILLLAFSVVITACCAEAAVRLIDGYPLTRLRLPVLELNPGGSPEISETGVDAVTAAAVKGVTVPAEVARDWFFETPDVPRRPRDARLQDILARWRPLPGGGFLPTDVYNHGWARNVCSIFGAQFKNFPDGKMWVFDPPEPTSVPYRFHRGVTVGDLSTNNFGFRGPDIALRKPAKTIRVAFLGASTTINSYGTEAPSYPEYVVYWLNRWAKAQGLDIAFEVVNGGRAGIDSPMIADLFKFEVAPLEPDLVVYYEGANGFYPPELIDVENAEQSQALLTRTPRDQNEAMKKALWQHKPENPYSAIVRRVEAALSADDSTGAEPAKPAYRLRWPKGLDWNEPDITRKDLPLILPTILPNLEKIRASAEAIGAQMVMSSFVWMVYDGMVVDPIKNSQLLWYLNRVYWPTTYRDMERLAAFQNRVFHKWAASHNLPFLDVAGRMPREPLMFGDAVHDTISGRRMRAWVTFLELLPVVRERIASGELPKPARLTFDRHPFLTEPQYIASPCD